MSRNQMINILVEDRLTDWVYAQNTFGLVDALIMGWEGFDKYSDKELKEMIEDNIGEEQIQDYLKSSAKRIKEERNFKIFP